MKKLLKIIGVLIIIFGALFINPNNLNAASATFKTTASTSKIVVGKTFTVTVKISSAEALGSWEYTINYDSSILSLVSGSKSVAGYGDGTKKSQSYTYKFKAIKSGSSNISVKSYNAISWNEKSFTSTTSGTTVKVITQADLKASYSKDNNLKSLTINNATLTPTFKADILEYNVNLDANTTSVTIKATPNDKKASVSGTGTFNVIEGENKFQLTVTAENGSEKTYSVIANVMDPNPIKVTVDNEELTIVKRISALTIPESYINTTAQINGQEVPAFSSEITNFTLVGLKNSQGDINLYIYKDNNFTLYRELKLNDLVLYPIEDEIANLKNYEKVKTAINNQEITAYKYTPNSKFIIITAMNVESGEKNIYLYDTENNTATFYNDEEIKFLNDKNQTYLYIIIGLLIETFVLFILIVLLIKKKSTQNKNEKQKIEKIKSTTEKKKNKADKNENLNQEHNKKEK